MGRPQARQAKVARQAAGGPDGKKKGRYHTTDMQRKRARKGIYDGRRRRGEVRGSTKEKRENM